MVTDGGSEGEGGRCAMEGLRGDGEVGRSTMEDLIGEGEEVRGEMENVRVLGGGGERWRR